MNLPEKALAQASEAAQPLNGAVVVPILENTPLVAVDALTPADKERMSRAPMDRGR